MKIAPLTQNDHPSWQQLWWLYLAESQRTLPAEVSDATWRRIQDDTVPIDRLAAWDGPDMVGSAHFLLHPTTWDLRQRWYLNDLFTHAAVRGRGVAKAMIAGVLDHASALGCDRVYWLTHETNSAARALYDGIAERSGFIEYQRKLV